MVNLYRIGVVALLWAEWAGPWRLPHHLDDPVSLVVGMVLGLASTVCLFPVRFAPLVTAGLGFGYLLWAPGANTIEAWLILSLLAASGTTGWALNARWILTGFFVASALHHLQQPWLSGLRIEALIVARYGWVVGPPWALAVAAVGWVLAEVGLAAGLWVERARPAVRYGGALLFGALYVGMFTGTLSAAVLLGLAMATEWGFTELNDDR